MTIADDLAQARAALTMIQPEPFNAEAPPEALAGDVTPVGLHYVRSNFALPAHDGTLEVGGAVGNPRSLTLDDLRAMPPVERVVTMECAGNGRLGQTPLPKGEPWGHFAVSTARWKGALSAFEKKEIYGVALSAPPEVMYSAVRARARQVSEQLRQVTLERIQASGVHLVQGEGRLAAGHAVVVRTGDGREVQLGAERVIIATGSRPMHPASVPFDDPRVFDSETITDITGKPRELLIVGGGAVGVEYATIFSALGVPVTIVDAAPQLAVMMDTEISARLEEVFLARGNRVILGTGLVSARGDGDNLAVDLTDGRQLHPDALLFAAGRSVTTAGLGLEHVDVEVDERGRIIADAQRQTSCPWVFAAGDVTGPDLASVAIEQGRQALCGALDLDFSVHVDQIPVAAVYGLPEVARVGMSEEDCAAEGIPMCAGAASSAPSPAASSPASRGCSS